jgi:hypothetical protein
MLLVSMQPDGKEVNKDALEAEADPPQRVQKRVQELVGKTPHLGRAANSDMNPHEYVIFQRSWLMHMSGLYQVRLGGIRALCRLADGAGLSTQEQIAMAFAEVRHTSFPLAYKCRQQCLRPQSS